MKSNSPKETDRIESERKSKRNVENLRRKFEDIQENKANSVENSVENSVKNSVKNTSFCPKIASGVRIFKDLDCQIGKSRVISHTNASTKHSNMIGSTKVRGGKAIREKCSEKSEFLEQSDQTVDPNGLKMDSLTDSKRSGKRKYPFLDSNLKDLGDPIQGVIHQHRKQVRISSLETGFKIESIDQLEMGSERENT